MKYGSIYVLTNCSSGKQYVGQTTLPIRERLQRRKGYNRHLRKALANDEFDMQVLAKATSKEELDNLERGFISTLGTKYPEGYNIQEGGHNGKHSEETKRKMSESRRGALNHNYGKDFSREHREKLSQAKIGRPSNNGFQNDPNKVKRARRVHALRCEGFKLREIGKEVDLSIACVSMILSGHRFPDVHSEELSNAR